VQTTSFLSAIIGARALPNRAIYLRIARLPISNPTLEFEPDLNLPVVPNNVGKTAVVNALPALLGATT
jgi:hypothetical protein